MTSAAATGGPEPAAADAVAWPSRRYAWYAVGILVLAYALAIVDRIAIGLLVEPIKADLHISDTQMGLLQGLAFAVFYSLFGLPLGVLVDRWKRVDLLAMGIFVWSAATAACGLARSYAMLFVGRIGVGAGEATVTPASSSLIADLFRPNERSRAYGVFMVGGAIGTALSYVVGSGAIIMAAALRDWSPGLFGGYADWQLAFMVMGAPGVVLALLVTFTLREPKRRDVVDAGQAFSLTPIWRQLKSNWAAYLAIMGGTVLNVMVVNAQIAWLPTMFIRAHGWTAAQVGATLGMLGFPAGTFSALSAGVVLSWLAARGRTDGPILVVMLQALVWAVFGTIKSLTPDTTIALSAHVVTSLFAIWAVTAALAGLNQITPNQFRGQITAIYTLFTGLIGVTIGPLMVGLLSDHVFPGPKGLQPSLATMYAVGGIGGVLLLLAARKSYSDAVIRARSWTTNG
jgi:MFS family permease